MFIECLLRVGHCARVGHSLTLAMGGSQSGDADVCELLVNQDPQTAGGELKTRGSGGPWSQWEVREVCRRGAVCTRCARGGDRRQGLVKAKAKSKRKGPGTCDVGYAFS